MKREFPILFAKASSLVAVPLLGLVTITYASRAVSRPANEIYGVGIVAFGVTAALSGICFAIPSSEDFLRHDRYAGEKFLHSSLLLIQTVMISYLKDGVTGAPWWHLHVTLTQVVNSVLSTLLISLAAASAWAWYFGFEVLNDELWRNWEARIRSINEAKTNKPSTRRSNEKGARNDAS